MFRKIVSNLSFSPALVGQLGFYAKRLRKEEATRKIGLVFVVLALIVQSLAVFQAPESANASGPNDFISGGLGYGSHKSINNFLAPYDSNTSNLKDIMNYVGITREEIASAQYGSFISGNNISWGRSSLYGTARGEKTVPITNSSGAVVTTVYARPMTLGYGSNTRIYGWIGHSAKIGWFTIMQACGNLGTTLVPAPPAPPTPTPTPTPIPTPKPTPNPPATCVYNSTLPADSKDCQPCAGDTTIWYKDERCTATIIQSKSAINVTQGSVDASKVVANGGDTIAYTVTIKNTGLASKDVTISDTLLDTLEYSTLIDNGGGTLDTTTKILSWPSVTLAPGASQVRSFVVRVMDPVPVTARGLSDPSSYDCHMVNLFGNSIDIAVNCAAPKVVEQVATQLPKTGPSENLLFAGIVLAITVYFYARSRQVKTEVRLIRHSLNAGTI